MRLQVSEWEVLAGNLKFKIEVPKTDWEWGFKKC